MSKINYLVVILILVGIGYVVISQVQVATQTASNLVTVSLAKKIQLKIDETYHQLKRFPNSSDEFEKSILGSIDLSKYPTPVTIENFRPGNRIVPAVFQIVVHGSTSLKRVFLRLEYYGTEYGLNPGLKGVLKKFE